MISSSYEYYFMKLFGLFLCSVMGILAGRIKNINKDSISNLIFLIISPVVFFTSTINTSLTSDTLLIVCIIFILCLMSVGFMWIISNQFLTNNQLNLAMFSGAASNSGYFLMVIALDQYIISSVNKYVVCIITITVFEYTVGKYICLKNHLSIKSIVRDLIRSPMIIALIVGLLLNILKIPLPSIFDEFIFTTRNSFAFLGMFLIGLNLSKINHLSTDLLLDNRNFLILMPLSKLLVQPSIYAFAIYVNYHTNIITDIDYINSLYIIMFAPIASSTIIYAKYLKIKHEVISIIILCSTVLSIFIIPIIVSVFLIT